MSKEKGLIIIPAVLHAIVCIGILIGLGEYYMKGLDLEYFMMFKEDYDNNTLYAIFLLARTILLCFGMGVFIHLSHYITKVVEKINNI